MANVGHPAMELYMVQNTLAIRWCRIYSDVMRESVGRGAEE